MPKIIPSDLEILKDSRYVYPTSDDMDKVLKQDFEKVVHSPEFKVLGF